MIMGEILCCGVYGRNENEIFYPNSTNIKLSKNEVIYDNLVLSKYLVNFPKRSYQAINIMLGMNL